MSAVGASQPETTRTETQLVDAAREGDERAFGELYERYARGIFAYVLGMVRDRSRAEDIVQDVFVSALRRMRSSDRSISFKPWIYEIAKNACIDEFRRVQRSREVPIEQDSGEYLASPAPSPDRCLEQRQQLDALHGAFRGLSKRQHTVMVQRELEGRSYAEIAGRTGMTLPMVESTLLRARRRLSEEYDDIASGRRCQQVHTVIETGGQSAVNGLRVRERRRFARHIAHCQPCARYARMAGVTVPDARRSLAERIAGLLPLPFARWFSRSNGDSGGGSHAAAVVRSAGRAARILHPGASAGMTPAAVASVAAVVIAGGGTAFELLNRGPAHGVAGSAGTTTARPAAVMRPARAARHSSGVHINRAAPVTPRSGQRVRVARPGGAGAAYRGRSSPQASSAVSPSPSTGSSGGAPSPSQLTGSAPSVPSVHSPLPASSLPTAPQTPQVPQVPSVPKAPKVPNVPKVPKAPKVPNVSKVTHSITNPVKKVVKKVPLPGSNPVGGVGGL